MGRLSKSPGRPSTAGLRSGKSLAISVLTVSSWTPRTQLWLLLRPAQVLADVAAQELDSVYRKGALITAHERGLLAVAVAEAKCLAHKAGIETSSQLFELTGARSTSAKYGFDRYWRNVRVHTLHDPVDYKLRDLGRYALSGTVPEPTAYS